MYTPNINPGTTNRTPTTLILKNNRRARNPYIKSVADSMSKERKITLKTNNNFPKNVDSWKINKTMNGPKNNAKWLGSPKGNIDLLLYPLKNPPILKLVKSAKIAKKESVQKT